jgi:thiol-disulfide isomerase/thioredoxin
MAPSVSVVCPSCEAVLKISKPSLIGKRVACPACKKPVLIQAPAGAVAQNTSSTPAKPREAAALKKAAPTSSGDPDTILLAEDDDLVGRSVPKPVAKPAKNDPPPKKKPRSSGVWKSMSEAETAEFEAMLDDTEAEEDQATLEMPFVEEGHSSGAGGGGKRGRDGSSDYDAMLVDTDTEQDELTAELPTAAKPERKRKRKSLPASASDPGTFEMAAEDSADEDYGSEPALPPRASSMVAPRRSASNATQKLPLIIAAFVGCSLVMGLLVYSVSGARAPSPLAKSNTANAPTGAQEKEENAVQPLEESEAPKSVSVKAKANAEKQVAAPTASENSGKDGSDAGKSPVHSIANGDQPSPGHDTLAAAIGGAETKRSDSASGEGPILGRNIVPFSATAVDNTTFQLADSKQKILVVAFLGVECPLANLYYPRLVELAQKYQDKSVGFVVVNSNAQDTLDDVHKQARVNKATFPVLKDSGNNVARLFGAERTPEVFVLDANRAVRYHGMVDDQYGYRQRRSQPTKNYVVDAVDALLAARAVSVAETPLQGCHIGRVTKASETAHRSFYRDVLPVLQNRCQQCHRKGEIGPFALRDFAEVRDWGPTIREAIVERRMPPWPADPHFGKFSNDISLSQAEIDTITQWVDEGCPEGNPAEKPPEKKFVDGWNIGKPDRVFTMERPFHVPATGVVDYQNIYASPVFTQDTWVQAVECRFGNRTVVHHMLVLLDFPKDHSRSQDGLVKGFFAAGAPGSTYFVFPKGYAKKIPKGARLRFQMHYTPNGTATEDQSKFGIVLAKDPKEREVQTYALGKLDINIPAGNPDHMEFSEQVINGDVILTTLMPHLHVRGKSFVFHVVWPDGKKETLLSVPRWDFNWQPQYQLAKPIVLKKGSKIIVEAHWDNSAGNPNNIFPLVDAQFGEQTFDEMFIGYVNFIPKSLTDSSRPHGRKRGS